MLYECTMHYFLVTEQDVYESSEALSTDCLCGFLMIISNNNVLTDTAVCFNVTKPTKKASFYVPNVRKQKQRKSVQIVALNIIRKKILTRICERQGCLEKS